MKISGTVITDYLIIESSNKLRDLFELTTAELVSRPYPRIVTRKDPSLDNYFAELLLRASYIETSFCPEFEEIVVRGSDEELPTKLNPQIKGAVLIGIGGKSNNRDIIAAYDEHSDDGTRTVDSASQVVFFKYLDKHKQNKAGIRSILPVLNEINFVDSHGEMGENHLNRMVKDLHFSKFHRPGFIIEEYPAQWKRAVVGAVLTAVCIKNKELRAIDISQAGKQLREVWKHYRKRREELVQNGLLMPIAEMGITADQVFNKALGRTASEPRNALEVKKETKFLFTMRRILWALEAVWGEKLAHFVINFFLEAKLQLGAEFEKTSKLAFDETVIPEAQCSLIYYLLSVEDLKPERGILAQLKKQEKEGFIVIKDSHRHTTAIMKSHFLPNEKWTRFVRWLQDREPGRWFVMFNEEKGFSEFILNGTRAYLTLEPSALSKDELIAGIREIAL
ncbi:MAG: hypothetical protein ACXWID_08350 [Pyrinomonadaceae bacterium]